MKSPEQPTRGDHIEFKGQKSWPMKQKNPSIQWGAYRFPLRSTGFLWSDGLAYLKTGSNLLEGWRKMESR
ncbi:MAG: hypothetical protein F6J93_23420 [Oscillatoria sp. SIO1A7]|nr:hypothetical protein [Oscillatoria sp. SIO1A7]